MLNNCREIMHILGIYSCSLILNSLVQITQLKKHSHYCILLFSISEYINELTKQGIEDVKAKYEEEFFKWFEQHVCI